MIPSSLPSPGSTPKQPKRSNKAKTSTKTEQTFAPLPSLDDDPTTAYVTSQLELFTLNRKKRTASEEDRRLELEDLTKRAKEMYLFDRKLAEAQVRDGRSEMEVERNAEKEKKQAVDSKQEEELASKANSPLKSPDTETTSPIDKATESDDDSPMFGDLLDAMPETEVAEDGQVVKVRDMALPKHLSGKSAKSLLEEIVRRKDRFARPSYKIISKSRAIRASVTILWEGGDQDVYSMQDEACYDQVQAFNYAATLALFALDAHNVARQLPGSFRDLWLELEVGKKAEEEAVYRDHIKMLKVLVETRNSIAQCAPAVCVAFETNGLL